MIRHNGIVIDRKAQSITHRGATWAPKSPRHNACQFRAMAMLILSAGVSAEQLFYHCYGHRADGGPMEGPHVFYVRFSMWKPLFERLHLDLRKVKTSGVLYYCLVPKYQFACANVA